MYRTVLLRLIVISACLMFLPGIAACTAVTTNSTTATNTTTTVTTSIESGSTEPIVVPTLPSEIPGYLQVDPDTGLHMTGTPTVVDFSTYRLIVSGKVAHELSLTYDDLRLMPKITATPQLVCPGFFVDTATWSGVQLAAILEQAGVLPDATSIVMKSADGYSARLDLAKALYPDNFLAYELAGKTLPVLQGFPLRAVLPGSDGYLWVKWLLEINVE
jgi:DMSO/TMAO reductase YedYZ molybdopterin-dependent catalytic subunit